MTPTDRAQWQDPQAYYTGPITADLTGTDWPDRLPAVFTAAQHFAATGDKQPMRDLWAGCGPELRKGVLMIMGVK